MQQIGKVLPAVQKGLATNSSGALKVSCSEPPRLSAIARLWQRMTAIYGHRWESAYGTSPGNSEGEMTLAGDTWQRGLTGLTEQQIAVGLNECIVAASPWPPTLPEFRAMCFQIPSLAEIRHELKQDMPRSGFVRLLWGYVDWYRYRHANGEVGDRMLKEAYEVAREAVMRGVPLPPEPVAVIEAKKPAHKPADPEVVKAHIEKMRRILEGDDAK